MNNSELGAFVSGTDNYSQDGLSKREYFAGLAMQGFLASGFLNPNIEDIEYAAKIAVKAADELLKELEKPINNQKLWNLKAES